MSEPPKRRPIRSFVLRSGRMTEAQQRAYDENWDQWGLEHDDGVLDAKVAFGRDANTVLEIGFGMGQSLVTMAAQAPETNFVGVEVHRAGVGKLLYGTQEQSLDNIRVYCHDAVEILRDCIAADSLAGVQIFFPDPWHKKRHNKRRLIQPGFVELLVTRLRPGGTLHVATDWQHYAEQIMNVLSACDQLDNSCPAGEYAPRPEYRPLTKFEARGERLGHGVWDLIFRRS
jgi:tRNA (guanine-N7-)-methyltransferase